MTFKRIPEKKDFKRPKREEHLYCEDAQIKAVRELIGGMTEKELYAVIQQLAEMGVI